MKKINKLIMVFLVLGIVVSILIACKDPNNPPPNPDPTPTQTVDYVSQLHFDMESETLKFKVPGIHQYIDGDTTHFDIPSDYPNRFSDGVFKARYYAVNTPESTGTIQDYGKRASKFVHDTLESAVSIYVESDSDFWDEDSTKSRVMAWIWYQPTAGAEYRNLNLELLQLGLGAGSNASSNRYGETCGAALAQAISQKLYVHSGTPDPEVYRGTAQQLSIRDLRLNQDKYNGIKVAVSGVVTVRDGTSAYIEDFDVETGFAYGVTLFLSYNPASKVNEAIQEGNYVLVVGTFQLSDYGFPPQITDIVYHVRKPNDPENTRLIESAAETSVKPSYKELTADEFFGNSTITYTVTPETDTTPAVTETKTIATAEIMRDATVCIKNIVVTEVYTTQSGNSKGAITVTGKVGSTTITVRTTVLFEDGKPVTEDVFVGKTIDVKGVVDFYADKNVYQVKIFSLDDVTFHQ